MKDFGLKSGSREICLSQSFEALNIRFKIPVQKESISRKFEFSEKIKGCQRELAAMMRGSNMGILPYWLIILLITWGLPAH
jgi:hypothetical protein